MSRKVAPPQQDELPLKGYDPRVVNSLVDFISPYKGQFLLSLLLMIVSSLAAVLGPYFVKFALDEGITGNSINALRQA